MLQGANWNSTTQRDIRWRQQMAPVEATGHRRSQWTLDYFKIIDQQS